MITVSKNSFFPFKTDFPKDLSDCEVVQIQPWLIEIIEPLDVTAPGPEAASPHCCYIRTVIFYEKPWRLIPGSGFAEHDRIDARLQNHDLADFEGHRFEIYSGRAEWDGARWIMRHRARRLKGEHS